MKLLDDYLKLQKQIYDYFGYKEDWAVIPLSDATEYYWHINGSDENGEVYYCQDYKNAKKLVAADCNFEAEGVDGNDVYSNEIYTQRFLPKWVYHGKSFTMICVDTRTDGNKFLQIFDNSKRV